MKFGDTLLDQAEGAILAHSLRLHGAAYKKGRRLSAADVSALRSAGFRSVIAATLDPTDVHEDEAARLLATALTGDGLRIAAPFTGRVNLYAAQDGLCILDTDRLHRINRCHEAITVATLPAFATVTTGQMVATIKVIPFAAPKAALDGAVALAAGTTPIAVAGYRGMTVRLIQTKLPGTAEKMLAKTVEVTRRRIEASGGRLAGESRCGHATDDLAREIEASLDAGCDLLLIAGASAITDRRDVLPAGIEAAGGTVRHLGMPVDPGNLLLLGDLAGTPVLGLPGCARSPKLNGFDWVLQRLAAGIAVTPDDIMDMGVGGLLGEIVTRPQPREGGAVEQVEMPRAARIGAIVLAAGRSSRMGPRNKLLIDLDGTLMVRRAVETALAAQTEAVVVVTGHQHEQVAGALAGLPVRVVHNPAYAEGLSTSLRRGLEALDADIDGALVCLGDMPRVTPAVLDRLVAAFNPLEGRAICVPVFADKRGNPVLWGREFFAEMQGVAGDVGARHLIGQYPDRVVDVAMADDSTLVDVDTPEALAALAGAGA